MNRDGLRRLLAELWDVDGLLRAGKIIEAHETLQQAKQTIKLAVDEHKG